MFFGEEVGAAVKNAGAALKEAVSAFKADPTKIVEVEAAANQAEIALEQASIIAVNQTMQAEAKSEHWMQWAWRPTCGFTASGMIVNNYIFLPYFEHLGLKPIVIPPEVWAFLTVVIGAAAYTRGKQKHKEAKEG